MHPCRVLRRKSLESCDDSRVTAERDETVTEPDSPSEILTPEQCAAYIGDITVSTLKHWRGNAAGPPWFYAGRGRKVRYRRAGVDAWAAQREVVS